MSLSLKSLIIIDYQLDLRVVAGAGYSSERDRSVSLYNSVSVFDVNLNLVSIERL